MNRMTTVPATSRQKKSHDVHDIETLMWQGISEAFSMDGAVKRRDKIEQSI